MAARHFLNDPVALVDASLRSVPYTNPAVGFDKFHRIIYRRPNHASQVALVSGGGSGHEPAFASFVGQGFLSASVAGSIFASPSAEQIRHALLHRVDSEKGILVVVMNYTGDVLNFGVAVEKAKASGLDVRMVVVGDDVGVGRAKGAKVGRRGIAGTVLVQKIAAALAATGASLDEVQQIAQLTAENVVSVGASLERVHVPGHPEPDDGSAAKGEIEIGMGIHNEPGSQRIKIDLPGLVQTMLAQLLDPADTDRAYIKVNPSDPVTLLLNNLGGVSVLEMGGITTEVIGQLQERYRLKPVRVLVGTYMTSLNGSGFSITLLKMVDTVLDSGKRLLDLLDAPAEASGWSSSIRSKTWDHSLGDTEDGEKDDEPVYVTSFLRVDATRTRIALMSGLKRLIDVEPKVTHYDSVVGDGDCGVGLKRGAEAILKQVDDLVSDDLVLTLSKIAQAAEQNLDGTSGALYAIFLNALVHSTKGLAGPEISPVTPSIWSQALEGALESLAKYTPAKPGDRTLMDALHPFVVTLGQTQNFEQAVDGARQGAERTKGMRASLGRSVYVGGDGWQEVPDPGAFGLSQLLQGLLDGCKESVK
ncbi:MAG: hypothetical protein M1817_005731 [Caeruleum heppii]|nr:MAG: hypothetical protein M1817_005731 [Caeruleum heppii]